MDNDIEIIKNSYANIGIELSDEKAMEIYNNIIKVSNELVRLFNNIWDKFKEIVKPIMEAYNSLKAKEMKKFRPVKILKPNKLNFVNKSKLIHCRNNC